VPLILHDETLGTFNVESAQPNAFNSNDLQFLELFCREVAIAINTLELLVADRLSAATESTELILREMAQPIDEILNDTAWILERYIGHDPSVCERLQKVLKHTRGIRQMVHKVGEKLAPNVTNPPVQIRAQRPKLRHKRVLVVDNDESVRIAAHELLGRFGCDVETAHHGEEALLMARTFQYDAVIADIRLPDMTGYDCFVRLREIHPDLPVILMTGFGYDPHHSIVKARQLGLKSVLYKPFRLDQLLQHVEAAVGDAATP
jgi:CheY-like chemotaxis protein